MVGCRVPRWGLKQVCRIYPNIVRASQATLSVSWQQQMPLASVGMDGKHCALLKQHTNPQHCYKTFGHKIFSTVVALVRKPSAVESAQGENILGMALYPQGEYLCRATLRTDVPFKASWLVVIYWEQCIFKRFQSRETSSGVLNKTTKIAFIRGAALHIVKNSRWPIRSGESRSLAPCRGIDYAPNSNFAFSKNILKNK